MRTLAIETSCDDTSVGIVSYDGQMFRVEKILAYSQIADHQKFGGVVPEIAYRLHSEKMIALLQSLGLDLIRDVDRISVTSFPWLGGSLMVGKTAAQMLGHQFHKPVIEVNHIYGHIFSLLLERDVATLPFPWVVLTASGGHNEIYLINYQLLITNDEWRMTNDKWTQNLKLKTQNLTITKLGQTLDDAAGECFDKVARMLGGPYPGGARIGQKALQGKPNELVHFSRIFLDHESYQFSFSGMKSQVHFLLAQLQEKKIPLDEQLIADIAYEFQEAVVEVLGKKLIQAAHSFNAKTIGIAGGVSANDRLFQYTAEHAMKRFSAKEIITENENSITVSETFDGQSIPLLRPMKKLYSTDNAAMIGVVWLITN